MNRIMDGANHRGFNGGYSIPFLCDDCHMADAHYGLNGKWYCNTCWSPNLDTWNERLSAVEAARAEAE